MSMKRKVRRMQVAQARRQDKITKRIIREELRNRIAMKRAEVKDEAHELLRDAGGV